MKDEEIIKEKIEELEEEKSKSEEKSELAVFSIQYAIDLLRWVLDSDEEDLEDFNESFEFKRESSYGASPHILKRNGELGEKKVGKAILICEKGGDKYYCKSCETTFDTLETFKNHLKTSHRIEGDLLDAMDKLSNPVIFSEM